MRMVGQRFGLFVNQVLLGKFDAGGTTKSAVMLPARIPAQSSFTLAAICANVLLESIFGVPLNAELFPVN